MKSISEGRLKRCPCSRDTRGITGVNVLFALRARGRSGLASAGVWFAPLRPWLLGAAVVLLVLGF